MPNFFWDSEPTLHPLYIALREYMEIAPRIKVLNERCRVFLELAEILSDSIADTKMTAITWIIIVLIVISIGVTVTEVGLRFAILEKDKQDKDKFVNSLDAVSLRGVGGKWMREDFTERELQGICGAQFVGTTFKGL